MKLEDRDLGLLTLHALLHYSGLLHELFVPGHNGLIK